MWPRGRCPWHASDTLGQFAVVCVGFLHVVGIGYEVRAGGGALALQRSGARHHQVWVSGVAAQGPVDKAVEREIGARATVRPGIRH